MYANLYAKVSFEHKKGCHGANGIHIYIFSSICVYTCVCMNMNMYTYFIVIFTYIKQICSNMISFCLQGIYQPCILFVSELCCSFYLALIMRVRTVYTYCINNCFVNKKKENCDIKCEINSEIGRKVKVTRYATPTSTSVQLLTDCVIAFKC